MSSTIITQTTLAAALTQNGTILNVVSATNISAPNANQMQKIYVINPDTCRGELMTVTAVSGTFVTVSRLDKYRQNFSGPSGNGGLGAVVLIAPVADVGPYSIGQYTGGFYEFNPVGGSFNPQQSTSQQPWLNVDTGEQWLYSALTIRWVPGWNNPSSLDGVTAAVASVAGQITPTGRLFHVTGTNAITGFTGLTGFAGGYIKIIPDAAFTYTATNNIGKAGTAVAGKTLTFTFDSNTGLFYPDYIA